MDPSIDPSTLPHDNRGNVLIGVVCVVCSIATIAVALRFYTRAFMVKQVGADDYLSLVALILALATGISQAANTRNGLGAHIWDLTNDGIKEYLEGFYISIALYNSGLMFVKLTFLTQYYRVLAIKKMRSICVIAMIIVGSWSLSQVLVGIFICDPIAGFWDQSLHAKCIPNLPQWYINAAGNIATDIAIFVLPMPVLGHLNLPKAQKLVLIGIFSLGFFTCTISVIRIKFLKQGGDLTYENVEGSSWSITELCSGVICACLPTLRPLVSRWVPALSTKLHKSSKGYRRQSGSNATDEEQGSKHTRSGSKASTAMVAVLGSKEELYHPESYEMRRSNSGEKSDGILGLRSTKEELESYNSSPVSPISPSSAHLAKHLPQTAPSGAAWLRPTVTTDITTSNSPRPDSERNRSSTAIKVKRDLFMQKTFYSAA
ncbi:hypothetical protein F5Y15DRAFT_14514 [Xylariaceae sp. FL0016]|nr:hypothetical protein F5Y15DRAFT_14514 [Xylariaceae sp. FL0016]